MFQAEIEYCYVPGFPRRCSLRPNHEGWIGWKSDIITLEKITLPAGCSHVHDTGIVLLLPENRYVRVAPRSGNKRNRGIDVFPGTIDPWYRQTLKVILENRNTYPVSIPIDDGIAQLILEEIHHKVCIWKETTAPPSVITAIKDGKTGGFGSTSVCNENETKCEKCNSLLTVGTKCKVCDKK